MHQVDLRSENSLNRRAITGAKRRGFILLEMLAALGISLLLCLALQHFLHRSFLFNKMATGIQRDNSTLLKVRHLLLQAAEDLDSYPFRIAPRKHAGGVITYMDGGEHPVMGTQSAPGSGSDAITVLALDFEASYRILRQESEGRLEFFACPKYSGLLSSQDFRGVIGVSVDGLWELHGSLRSHAGRIECRDFTLSVMPSLVLKRPDSAPLGIRLLVPISRYYTIYLDRHKQVRYLGHAAGGEIIENQPLFGNLLLLTAQINEPLDGIYCLETGLVFNDRKTAVLSSCSRLGRTGHLNYLLNG